MSAPTLPASGASLPDFIAKNPSGGSHARETIKSRCIFLLRHATAEPDGRGGDQARRLTASGRQEARRLGQAWLRHWAWPQRILCSSAARTRETLEQLAQGAASPSGESKTHFSEDFYHAMPGTWLEQMQALPAETESVLLVGHNPTMHQTAALLCAPDAFASEPGKWLMSHYPPCTLTVFSLPETSGWSDIGPASLRLVGIHASQKGWMRRANGEETAPA